MSTNVHAEGEAAVSKEDEGLFKPQVVEFTRLSKMLNPLFKDINKSAMEQLFKAAGGNVNSSSQGTDTGIKEHPFDYDMVARFQTANPHHGRCIHTKVSATVGLGFETEADKARMRAKRQGLPEPDSSAEQEISKVDTVLDPLTRHSWQDLLNDVAEDYWQTGNGFIEVVRQELKDDSDVIGLYHIPAREVKVNVEDRRYNYHFEVTSPDDVGGSRLFARFGDLERFVEAHKEGSTRSTPGQLGRLQITTGSDGQRGIITSEVIHIRRPTSLSRWYGFPDWLSAVPSIELAQMLIQHNYDFFLNRGVPEFMLLLFGQRLDKATRATLEKTLQPVTGLGNSHKSVIVSLPLNSKAQMEKLALEHSADGQMFSAMSDNLGLQILSAHGVPALLAGIQIPGKLGASNEMVQAMIMFQILVISPAQRIFERTLTKCLGDENTGLDLSAGDFTLNKLLTQIDLPALDTVARQRQDPTEASAQGRTPDQGLRD